MHAAMHILEDEAEYSIDSGRSDWIAVKFGHPLLSGTKMHIFRPDEEIPTKHELALRTVGRVRFSHLRCRFVTRTSCTTCNRRHTQLSAVWRTPRAGRSICR